MPTVDVWNLEHERVGKMKLADDVFGRPARPDLVSAAVRSQMSRLHPRTACTKTRGDVSGTGAKPFRQKHTGRARQGTRRAPQHRGGGVAFGPKPRSGELRLPKKVQRQAMCSVLSEQARNQRLFVLDDFSLPEIKTRRLKQVVDAFGLRRCLVVDEGQNVNLRLSARNLPRVAFLPVEGVTLLDLLRHESLLISQAGVKKLEGALQP